MGPLAGLRVIEFAGLGPAPFCAMLLADLGAEVIRFDRMALDPTAPAAASARGDVLGRGRRSIAIDLKEPAAIEVALRVVERSDALVEGFRPGVMEKLGLGPEVCLARNPRLVYGRATGWGQSGPLAHCAGHDINYIALSGVLHSMRRRDERPLPVPGFAGDFGGGGMLLALGIVAAVLAARESGHGQTVDAAITDGSALLAALIYGWRAVGLWRDEAGSNSGDSGAHFYDTYRCADGKYIAVGAIEPRFYALLVERCGLSGEIDLGAQWKPEAWAAQRQKLAQVFTTRTRDQWCELLEGTDACFAPVLDLAEAPRHPHNRARGTFVEIDGVVQPGPAPRFGRDRPDIPGPSPMPGADTDAILAEHGWSRDEIGSLRERGVVVQAAPPGDGRPAGARSGQ